MLEIQGDAFIFGGDNGLGNGKSAIYRLTCSSGICSWSTLNQSLNVARYSAVAIRVPDNFGNFCLEGGEGATSTSATTILSPTPDWDCVVNWNCCTVEKPCEEGEGDCDFNNQCAEGLICGVANCIGPEYPLNADCCEPSGRIVLGPPVTKLGQFGLD